MAPPPALLTPPTAPLSPDRPGVCCRRRPHAGVPVPVCHLRRRLWLLPPWCRAAIGFWGVRCRLGLLPLYATVSSRRPARAHLSLVSRTARCRQGRRSRPLFPAHPVPGPVHTAPPTPTTSLPADLTTPTSASEPDAATKEGLNCHSSTSLTASNSVRSTDNVPPNDQMDLVGSCAALPQSDSTVSVSEHQQSLTEDMEVPSPDVIGKYRSNEMFSSKVTFLWLML